MKLPVTILCLLYYSLLPAQNDTSYHEPPITLQSSYVSEFVTNHRGGLKTGTCYQGMANFTLSFDTRHARLWNGGTFYINAAHTHGGNPSTQFIGDFQVASNIEADNLTYFHEMWYSQSFGNANLTIGLQDLNVEFAASDYASLFVNSSFGVHSTIADNIIAPIFPLTAFGIQFKYDLSPTLGIKLIAFDGFPTDFSENNPYNLHWNFTREDGLLNIVQINYKTLLRQNLTGAYSIGSYSHQHFTAEKVNKTNHWEITNYGFYLTGDQQIAQYTNGSILSSFLQASISPYQKNENCFYLGFGFHYSGILCKNKADVTGIAIAHAGFDTPGRDETTIELTYQYKLNDRLSVQPDIQYIINPTGTGQKLPNALVTALRFNIEL